MTEYPSGGFAQSYRDLTVYRQAVEAAETQVWLELAVRCGYLRPETAEALSAQYEGILAQLVTMIAGADRWTVKPNN